MTITGEENRSIIGRDEINDVEAILSTPMVDPDEVLHVVKNEADSIFTWDYSLARPQLRKLYDRLVAIGMAQPGAELARDVVACPGADTCNIAVTQSRGLAKAIGERLEDDGLAEVGGVRINISGCTNSCGQHHIADIGFFGAERRARGRSAPGHVVNLGHGVPPETDPDVLSELVTFLHKETR